MAGDDDRGAPKGRNPFFDEGDAPPPRRKKVKPPPGIITAGGVDMARAHASGIKVREAAVPEHPSAQPKVVVAVETDPRKVPTHKRLLPGRAAGEERSALLPEPGLTGASPASAPPTPRTGQDPKAPPRAAASEEAPVAPVAKDPPLPRWMRVAFVAVGVLLLVGLARQARFHFDRAPAEHPSASAVPIPIPPRAPTAVESAAIPADPEPPRAPLPTAKPDAAPPKTASPAEPAHPKPKPAASASAKPGFVPPFQLPGEKY
jgi:hypothetical protein